jgi:hypothetical protein
MITSVLIIAFSVVLFIYWLRYSCVLLLRNARERAGMSTVADERFSFFDVAERLKRDYHVVMYLIEHTANLELASIENKLLVIDCKLMRLWSRVTRTMAPRQSRNALAEMAAVLTVLVGQMREQSRLQTE